MAKSVYSGISTAFDDSVTVEALNLVKFLVSADIEP